MRTVKRTFEALRHAPGTADRARLNLSWVTSEYLPSIRYGIIEDDGTPTCWNYRTKRECEEKIAQRAKAEGRG